MRNNPLRYNDPTGQWFWEVLTNQQSFADFKVELGGAAQILYDSSPLAKTAMDHPVGAGAVIGLGSGLAAYGASAGITYGLTGLGIGGTQADKAAHNIIDRPWSSGRVGSSIQNLTDHFNKHGGEFNTNSVSDYYNKANNFINSKAYNYSWNEGSDAVRYNSQTNVINITNKANEIKSFYTVTDQNKLNSIGSIINKLKSK